MRSRPGKLKSWVATMLGHMSPEMLFSAYAWYIPNGTRRDGSALLSRMTERKDPEATEPDGRFRLGSVGR